MAVYLRQSRQCKPPMPASLDGCNAGRSVTHEDPLIDHSEPADEPHARAPAAPAVFGPGHRSFRLGDR